MTYADRLAAALEHSMRSRSSLANALGVSPQAIGYVLKGKTKSLSAPNNAQAAAFLKVNPDWLATGEGEMAAAGGPGIGFLKVASRAILPIPIVGLLRTSIDGYSTESRFPDGQAGGDVDFLTRDRSAYALRVKGDNLSPRYRADELLILTPSVPPVPGRDVLVTTNDGRILVLHFVSTKGDLYQFQSRSGFVTRDKDEIKTLTRIAGAVIDDGTQGQ